MRDRLHQLSPPAPAARTRRDYFAGPWPSGEVVPRRGAAEGELIWLGAVAPALIRSASRARPTGASRPRASGEPVRAGEPAAAASGGRPPVVEAWERWRPGQNYFGEGNDEAVGDRARGRGTYEIVVEFAHPGPGRQGGADRRHEAAGRRGDRARSSWRADRPRLFVGLNGEWDTEGQDRPDLELPGRQNELIERWPPSTRARSWCSRAAGRSRCPGSTGRRRAPGLVSRPGMRQRDRRRAVRQGRSRRPPAAELPVRCSPGRTRPPATTPARTEGNAKVFVGYRHYERTGIRPQFPFGHGLSYTHLRLRRPPLGTDRIAPAAMTLARRHQHRRPRRP